MKMKVYAAENGLTTKIFFENILANSLGSRFFHPSFDFCWMINLLNHFSPLKLLLLTQHLL